MNISGKSTPLAPQNADKICFWARDSICELFIVILVHSFQRGVQTHPSLAEPTPKWLPTPF